MKRFTLTLSAAFLLAVLTSTTQGNWPPEVPPRTSHTLGVQKVLMLMNDFTDDPRELPEQHKLDRDFGKLDEHFKQLSYYKTGLDFTLVPEVIHLNKPVKDYSYNDQMKDAMSIAKAKGYDPDDYHRIWLANPKNLNSQGKAGGKYVWIGFGNGAKYLFHEFAHTYGIGHPRGERIEENVGVGTRVQWKWITEDDPNGFAYQAVEEGTFTLYDFRSSQPMPGGLRAIDISGGKSYFLGYAPKGVSKEGGLFVYKRDDMIDTAPDTDSFMDASLIEGESYILKYQKTSVETDTYTITAGKVTPAEGNKPASMQVAIQKVSDESAVNRSNNLLKNPSFENGLVNWQAKGAVNSISSVTAPAKEGSQVLLANITGKHQGVRQDVTEGLKFRGPGSYYMQAWVNKKYGGSSDYKVTVKLRYGGQNYYRGVKVSSNQGQWAKIVGTLDLNWTGTLEQAEFYIESTAKANFYADAAILRKMGELNNKADGNARTATLGTAKSLTDEPVLSEAVNLRVWPNPSNGTIQVQALGLDGQRVLVHDLMGRKVAEAPLQKGQATVDLTEQAGMYLLRVGNQTHKVIIK